MRLWWQLILEEYKPKIWYIKGSKNIAVDALSCLKKLDNQESYSLFDMADCYGNEKSDLPCNAFLITYSLIKWQQKQDKSLLAHLWKEPKNYSLQDFHGGDRSHSLICWNGKIVLPSSLQSRTVHWYHYTLCHPGINRTEETIGQHFYWPKMRDIITREVSMCAICQKQRNSARSMAYFLLRKQSTSLGKGFV